MSLPNYLIIVTSSCQLFSGTGVAIFDWIRFAKNDFEFSILMDFENLENFRIAKKFCEENGVLLYSSRGLRLPGCIDSGIREIHQHLCENEYAFIECISWASCSAHLATLSASRGKAKLIFTPHSQPIWTLEDPECSFMVDSIFKQALYSSDFIFVDSPSETNLSAFDFVPKDKTYFVPLGVDTKNHFPMDSPVCAFQICCVCDFHEHRKRVDLLFDAFSHALSIDSRLHLVIAGRGSDEVALPSQIASAVTALGYINRHKLIAMYQTSALFALLSDYEAFGLPIAEALCCGCPVLLNRTDVLEGIFSELPGVYFTNNRNASATAELMCEILLEAPQKDKISASAQAMFSFATTYGVKRSILIDSFKEPRVN